MQGSAVNLWRCLHKKIPERRFLKKILVGNKGIKILLGNKRSSSPRSSSHVSVRSIWMPAITWKIRTNPTFPFVFGANWPKSNVFPPLTSLCLRSTLNSLRIIRSLSSLSLLSRSSRIISSSLRFSASWCCSFLSRSYSMHIRRSFRCVIFRMLKWALRSKSTLKWIKTIKMNIIILVGKENNHRKIRGR